MKDWYNERRLRKHNERLESIAETDRKITEYQEELKELKGQHFYTINHPYKMQKQLRDLGLPEDRINERLREYDEFLKNVVYDFTLEGHVGYEG